MKNLFFIWLALLAAIAIPSTAQSATTPEALDGPGFAWAPGGDNPKFFPTTVVADTHDGIDGVKSGNITHNQENFLRTSVIGPGTLTFWWKVSSELNWDTFGFWIGYSGMHYIEPPEIQISGEVGWAQQTFSIPEGTQFLEWAYVKDDSNDGGVDFAWLDEVYFTPDPPMITNQPSEEVVVVPVGTNVSFSVGYQGNPNPAVFWQFNGTNLLGKTNATLTLTNLQVSQSGQYRAIITNIYGSDTSAIVALTVAQPFLLEWGLDTTGLVWTTGSDAGAFWSATNGNVQFSHDGIDFARSGLAPDDYEQLSFESWIQTTVTGPGTLKFWWRLLNPENSELSLIVGASNKTNVPPSDETWQEEIVAVPSGNRIVRWTYLRGDFISQDDTDGAYLDQVRFSPATNAPPIFSQPEFTTNGFSSRIELDPFRGYRIQRSTNLTSWVDVTNFTTTESIFDFLDATATNSGSRYYRIKSP